MKNVLLYTSNDNRSWIDKTINSINSFFYFNPERKDDTTVVLLTDDKSKIDLSKVQSGVRYEISDQLSYDYKSFAFTKIVPALPIMYRFEVFENSIFDDADFVLSLDGDTVVQKNCRELFDAKNSTPFVGFTRENPIDCNLKMVKQQLEDEANNLKWYANMGFLLLTPKLLGKSARHAIFAKCMDLCRNHLDFLYPDQDALAVTFNGEEYRHLVKFMDSKYNFNDWILDKQKVHPDDIVIVHYAGANKNYKLEYLDT